MTSIKYNPRTLQRLCAASINKLVRTQQDIKKLEIPNCMKELLEDNYFSDNLWCDDKLPPIECNDYPYDHAEPYVQLSNDEFLSLHRYREVPWFAYGRTHINKVWYEIDWNNEPICWTCAREANRDPRMHGRVIYRIASCFISPGEHVLDAIQGLDMWCSNCYTVSLFWLSEYIFRCDHYTEEYTRDIELIHRIESKPDEQ